MTEPADIVTLDIETTASARGTYMLAVVGTRNTNFFLKGGGAGALLVGPAPPHMLQSCVAMLTLSSSSPRTRFPCQPDSALVGPSVGFLPHRVASIGSLQPTRRSSGFKWTTASAAGPPVAVTPHSTGEAEEAAGELRQPPAPSDISSEETLAKARREARFDKEGEYRVFRELLEGKKTRFVSRVMYDGTNYKGFQLQNNGLPTVQVRNGTDGPRSLQGIIGSEHYVVSMLRSSKTVVFKACCSTRANRRSLAVPVAPQLVARALLPPHTPRAAHTSAERAGA